ncbi:TPA: hypothetical protein P4F40_004968 [Escherichia coli]|nr:hypothetical protein [Escherichia coli]HDO7554664.1 hypothetical protein [Escherichia coli]
MFDCWPIFLEVKNLLYVVLFACLQVFYGTGYQIFCKYETESMGRKSRLKKERKETFPKVNIKMNSKILTKDEPIRPVYRFFKEKIHAEALCDGKVWLSTLETCRAYEDPLQGDRGEAMHSYSVDNISGGSSDAGFVEMCSRLGIGIGEGCSNVSIGQGKSFYSIKDAFVLCTTKEFNPSKLNSTFGNYCVEIACPIIFFEEVTKALNKIIRLKSAKMGAVIYDKREFTGLEPIPGPIGFVKPKDIYSDQKEFRFLWETIEHVEIKPLEVHCPSIARLCKLVS